MKDSNRPNGLAAIEAALEAAAFDPSSWTTALNKVAETFDATMCCVRTVGRQELRYLASQRGLEVANHYVSGAWGPHDLAAVRFAQAPTSRIMQNRDLLSEHELNSAYYGDFAARLDITHMAGWRIRVDDCDYAFAINRAQKSDDLTPDELATFRQLMPTATSAMLLSAQFSAVQTAAISDLVHLSTHPTLVLNKHCGVIAKSESAAVLFNGRFGVKEGRLWSSLPSATEAIAKLYQAMQSEGAGPVDPFVISQHEGSRIVAYPLLLRHLGCDLFAGARALLTLRAIDQPFVVQQGTIRRLFNLTAAEAHIAALIAEGRPLTEIAALRQVSVETVRTILKAVFAKTGARSQATLTSLLLRATLS